jgi:hypothetical protein
MRMVTHRQIARADVDRALEVFAALWNEAKVAA